MKKILFITSLFISSFIFGQITEGRLVGEWSNISETYSNCEKPKRNASHVSKSDDGCLTSAHGIVTCKQVSFKTENKYYSKAFFNDTEMVEEGTYKIDGDKLTITIDGYPKEYAILLTDNQMTLTTTLLGCDYKVVSKKK